MTSPLPTLDRFRSLLGGKSTAELRASHLLEQMPGAAFLVLPRTGSFLEANSRATAFTGWTRDELRAQALAEVLASPDGLRQIHDLQAGQSLALEDIPFRARAGRAPEVVDIRVTAFSEGGETVTVLTAAPAAERRIRQRDRAAFETALNKLTELFALFDSPTPEMLQAATARAREALSADAAGLFLTQSGSNKLQLACEVDVPPAFPRVLGPSEVQTLRAPFRWSLSQRSEDFLSQACRAAGFGHLITHPVGEAPGIIGVVFAAYAPEVPPPGRSDVLLAFVASSLTHLHRQIQRVAKAERSKDLATRRSLQLDALNAQIAEGVIILDAHGLVDEINSAAGDLLGYHSADVTGLRFDDVLVPDDTLTAAIHNILDVANKATTFERRGSFRRRDGEAFPVQLRMRRLTEGGHELGAILVFSDLSRDQAAQSKQEHLDHLTYVGQSTATFAHEIRNPLNAIHLGVEMIAAQFEEGHALHGHVEKIQAETQRLSELMNELLAWTKPIDPKLEPTDLKELLGRLLQRWKPKFAKANVSESFNAPDGRALVLADARMVERVFTNLIDNACKAMPSGGQLSVWIKPIERAGQSAYETIIHDSGRGIPDEMKGRIFDPYVTGRADGTGLGLAICKRIITVHHGGIDVDSYPGAGTAFKVTLPRLQE